MAHNLVDFIYNYYYWWWVRVVRLFQLRIHRKHMMKHRHAANMLLQTALVFLCLILETEEQALDTSYSYYTGSATAMDINYASSFVVFANQNKQIVKYSIASTPAAALQTISTSHKAKITSLGLSPDGSKILSGGSDYTAAVYNMGTGALICSFDELRGDIISAKIASDNDFYAFSSNQGYLYYGHISNCSKTKYNKTDFIMSGLVIIQSRTEIWVIDGQSNIIVLNYISSAVRTYLMPTSKVSSIFEIPAVNKIGVCTQRAFYILDYLGSVQFTLANPTVYTRGCRIAHDTGNVYYLTAIHQSTAYTLGALRYPLWNIWKVDIGANSAVLYLEQTNAGSRYGASSTVVEDAATIQVGKQIITAVSIADGFNPYYNLYQDIASSSCSSGYFDNGNCEKCNWNDSRAFCTKCSAAPVCTQCLVLTYLDSSKACLPCPSNCYACSSSSVCTACIGGYTLISTSCIVSNLTGCVHSYAYTGSGYTVSKCYRCEIGYFAEDDLQCKLCSEVYANCSECDDTVCTRCEPNFLMNPTSTNCEICTHAIEGCAACLNQTYCDTCYESYPYFSFPSVGARICKQSCKFPCATCDRLTYDICLSCEANKTLVNNTCTCQSAYPIYNSTTLQCQACSDFLSNCLNCTSSTFCTQCDTGYYFQNTSSTEQTCQTCNYTCLTCTTTWYQCASCDPGANRVLDPVSKRCVCSGMAYFQMGSQVSCEECQAHIANCLLCYNQSFCITCDSSYYIKSTGSGTNTCDRCLAPCSECFGNSTNCTNCATGRQLNTSTHTCDCLSGFYSTNPTSCAPCSPALGSCLQCSNDSVCLQCWANNYFVMVNGAKKCDLCQITCLTCATWTTICATCDSLAHRVLDPVTHQCNCMVGYTETNGRCLNCTATFQFCTSCDATTCFACEPGYSLAYGGLKCVDCALTYPGCIQCLNGLCAACNQSAGYELSYSKCICQPGYYFKQLDCLPYAMGANVQRLFKGYATFSQDMNTSLIQIQIYFRCEGLKIPYGMANSVTITINDQVVSQYSVTQKNTTLTFSFMPSSAMAHAKVVIEFKNKTIYDLDEYGPKDRVFEFTKNIFVNSTYELTDKFSAAYEKYIVPAVRWSCSLLVLLGSADFILMVVFTVHLIPAFVLLSLSPPMPLYNTLRAMVRINYQSLFVFADLKTGYEAYDDNTKYLQVYGVTGGVVNRKIMDLVFLGCVLIFYGILLPRLTPYIPEGRVKKLWISKFQLKRYSTITNSLLCLVPSFLFCAILDLRMEEFNPASYFTIAISLVVLAFSFIYVFTHAMLLYSSQFDDTFKNEDCYFGASILEPKSVSFILSLLIVGVCGIPLLGLFPGVYCLPILMAVLLWNIGHFRWWDNFPNKVLYFIKLAYSMFLLFFTTSFLIFDISEKYSEVDIKTIDLLGLISLVLIIVLFSLAALEATFSAAYWLYKNCKHSANLVDNIEDEKERIQEASQDTSSISPAKVLNAEREQETFNAKLTNKQEHMKKFREQHLKTTMSKMYEKGAQSQSNFNSTSRSKKGK